MVGLCVCVHACVGMHVCVREAQTCHGVYVDNIKEDNIKSQFSTLTVGSRD